jgi:hypothetical protein
MALSKDASGGILFPDNSMGSLAGAVAVVFCALVDAQYLSDKTISS